MKFSISNLLNYEVALSNLSPQIILLLAIIILFLHLKRLFRRSVNLNIRNGSLNELGKFN